MAENGGYGNWLTAAIVGALAGVAGAWFFSQDSGSDLSSVESRVQYLEERETVISTQLFTQSLAISRISIDTDSTIIDFSIPGVQDIGEGFSVVQASQEEHLTGIRFTGRVINREAVDHTSVKFQVMVSGKSQGFMINRISSGNSTAFNVYVPDLDASESRYARVQYLGSTVAFRTK